MMLDNPQYTDSDTVSTDKALTYYGENHMEYQCSNTCLVARIITELWTRASSATPSGLSLLLLLLNLRSPVLHGAIKDWARLTRVFGAPDVAGQERGQRVRDDEHRHDRAALREQSACAPATQTSARHSQFILNGAARTRRR